MDPYRRRNECTGCAVHSFPFSVSRFLPKPEPGQGDAPDPACEKKMGVYYSLPRRLARPLVIYMHPSFQRGENRPDACFEVQGTRLFSAGSAPACSAAEPALPISGQQRWRARSCLSSQAASPRAFRSCTSSVDDPCRAAHQVEQGLIPD